MAPSCEAASAGQGTQSATYVAANRTSIPSRSDTGRVRAGCPTRPDLFLWNSFGEIYTLLAVNPWISFTDSQLSFNGRYLLCE